MNEITGSLEGDSNLAPSLFDFGKVRLHVGDAAPTTFFVSRHFSQQASSETMTSEVWEAELSKIVQLTANSISAAFYQGAAACHVSMAGEKFARPSRLFHACFTPSCLRPGTDGDRDPQEMGEGGGAIPNGTLLPPK